jgi:hypothetical protein
MRPDLQPKDLLSQVVFVHDYVQLVFQDSGFTLYNPLIYQDKGVTLTQGDAGFCDALVKLIGSSATVETAPLQLVFRFSNGASFHMAIAEAAVHGPEAWTFSRLGRPLVVEQNA